MSDIDEQEKLVRWGYGIQWATFIFPPSFLVSPVYLLLIRDRVTHAEVRSHLNWQLMTFGVIAAMVPIGLLLLFIGLAGVNNDNPISIIATFTLMGISWAAIPWLLYRLIRGSLRLSQQVPMERLFP